MTARADRKKRSKIELMWWAICAAALAVGLGVFVGTSPSKGPTSVALTSSPTTVAGPPTTSSQPRAGQATVAHSIPRTLLIPSIGVNTSLGIVGLQPDGQVMVPPTARTASWYRYGPTPGNLGSSVILGHVDSHAGPGVFFELRTLRAGARIDVILADGVTTHFTVTTVVQYPKTNFPDQLVYGSHGARLLNLVTCGGVFDHATGHYESNIVVFSRFVSVSPSLGK